MRKLILTFFILFLLLVGTVRAAEVTLQWDPSIDAPYLDPEKAYRVYQRTSLEEPYVLFSENQTENNLIGTVANHVLTFTATVPDGDYQCWFVVTATDDRGLESAKSNEITYLYVRPAPGAPQNLRRSENDCFSDIDQDGDVDIRDKRLALRIFRQEFGRTDCIRR